MRIVSGKFKGKKLISPKNDKIRPTTDKVKESVFNMLQGKLYNCSFLDLFSGTGAMSLEAMSRDASFVVMVEKSPESVSVIKSNIKSLKGLDCNYELAKRDVIEFLSNESRKYDLIFADPPYSYDKINDMINIIAKRELLNDDGKLIIETVKDFQIILPKNMNIVKEKIYSISKITVIERNLFDE